MSLETSEAMFDIGVALNACGYDRGLDDSDPVRKRVRDEVNQALVGTARGRDDRDKLCVFIDRHRLEDPARSLAQYVSLGLYLTPPPAADAERGPAGFAAGREWGDRGAAAGAAIGR